jgi:hypothetical protein
MLGGEIRPTMSSLNIRLRFECQEGGVKKMERLVPLNSVSGTSSTSMTAPSCGPNRPYNSVVACHELYNSGAGWLIAVATNTGDVQAATTGIDTGLARHWPRMEKARHRRCCAQVRGVLNIAAVATYQRRPTDMRGRRCIGFGRNDSAKAAEQGHSK